MFAADPKREHTTVGVYVSQGTPAYTGIYLGGEIEFDLCAIGLHMVVFQEILLQR